ncbi:MAG: alpha/beta hydrolase [Planctomycetia bacterium]|nr:alpha/beta hydrolase [Planctomycetia bacterium]
MKRNFTSKRIGVWSRFGKIALGGCFFGILGLFSSIFAQETVKKTSEISQEVSREAFQKGTQEVSREITQKIQKVTEKPTADILYYTETMPIVGDEVYARERCRLDVYRPKNRLGTETDNEPENGTENETENQAESVSQKVPVVVWFHGGGLSGGNRHIPGQFLNQKFLVVPVNYRLFPRARCQEAIFDAAAAVAWVLENISAYGGNPEKVCVAGHSAGGYLAAMVALDARYLAKFGKSNMDIYASLPVSGQMTTHFQVVGERRDATRTSGANNPLQIDEMAPLFYTTKPCPNMHLLVGDPKLEWQGRVEENYLFAAMLRTIKGHKEVEIRSYDSTNHGTVAVPACEYIRDYVNQLGE